MKYIAVLFISFFLLSCEQEEIIDRSGVQWFDMHAELQEALILAAPGDTIMLPAGYFSFRKSLLIDDKDSIILKGAGMDETVLSFLDQQEGAEGIKISHCSNITLADFTIEDASGDNIKVNDTDGITFRKVKSQWTGPASEENGAYALYPVLCKNVLIEECIAIGASDAGVYVGQSDQVIIRNNIAKRNVAGIESENSNHVQIYGNLAENNTGGILVFDLPGLTQYGKHIKVYKNVVKNNNHRNFAPEGNIVGVVPPGTGVMLLATEDVEVYENEITDNRTVGVAIISYELVAAISEEESSSEGEGSAQRVNNNYELDSAYNPYVRQIKLHHNNIQNSHWFATFSHDFGLLFNYKFPFNPPDIAFDGFMQEGLSAEATLCLDQDEVHFVNLDAPNDLDDMNEKISPFKCM